MEDRAIELLTALLQARDRLLELPGARAAWETFAFFSSLSGAFWLLSRLFGVVAVAVDERLDRSLAVLFTVFYNAALALLYASMMVFAVELERAGRPGHLRTLGAGFVFVYAMLCLVYADRDGRVGEYGVLGFAGGAVGYLAFALRPAWLQNPVTPAAYALCNALLDEWVGRFVIAWAVFDVARRQLGRAWGRLTWRPHIGPLTRLILRS